MSRSEGPVSNAKPSASSRPILPPGWSFFSKTSTSKPFAASRIAAASEPIPAPTTAIRFARAASRTPAFLSEVYSVYGADANRGSPTNRMQHYTRTRGPRHGGRRGGGGGDGAVMNTTRVRSRHHSNGTPGLAQIIVELTAG